MASVISIPFKNGTKQDYELLDTAKVFPSPAELAGFKPEDVTLYLLTSTDSTGASVQVIFRSASSRGGIQLLNPDTGALDATVTPVDAFLGSFTDTLNKGGRVSIQKVQEYKAADPTVALVAEADGYAAQLVKLGKLTDAAYLKDKAATMGAAWTVASATSFRDKYKTQLATAKASEATKAPIGLIVGGIVLALFLLTRKKVSP